MAITPLTTGRKITWVEVALSDDEGTVLTRYNYELRSGFAVSGGHMDGSTDNDGPATTMDAPHNTIVAAINALDLPTT